MLYLTQNNDKGVEKNMKYRNSRLILNNVTTITEKIEPKGFVSTPDFLNSYGLKRIVNYTYGVLLRKFNTASKIDKQGRYYIEMSRQEIANFVGVSLKTITKYIKLLHNAGLIYDLHRGLTLINHIYFRTPICFQNEVQENTEETSDIKIVKEKIKASFNKVCSNKAAKNILIACDNQMEEVDKGIAYMSDKEVINPVKYLIKTLKNKWYEPKNSKSNTKGSVKSGTTKPKGKSNKAFTTMEQHGWDLDYMDSFGHIKFQYETNPLLRYDEEFVNRATQIYRKLVRDENAIPLFFVEE